MNALAYTILAAIVGSAAWFIHRQLTDAIDEAFDDAHGDWPSVPNMPEPVERAV